MSLTDDLRNLSERPVRPHTPAHGGRAQFDSPCPDLFAFDLSEIAELDDLHAPQAGIAAMSQVAAEMFGFAAAWPSVNGASGCIMAACLALGESGTVLAARNSHKSLVSGLVLSGAQPVWIEPEWHSRWGIYGPMLPDTLDRALRENPDARACFLTSPTYEGLDSDLDSLGELCHQHGVALVVDESHGAHRRLLGEISGRPDLSVLSPHKCLGSLTQTGLLLWDSELIPEAQVSRAMSLLQTTSPSFPLLASLDACLRSLRDDAGPLHRQVQRAQHLRKRLQAHPHVDILPNHDPCRIGLRISGLSGEGISREMAGRWEPELVGDEYIMLLLSLADSEESDATLLHDLWDTAQRLGRPAPAPYIPAPAEIRQATTPRQGWLGQAEDLEFRCPPGVPIKIPGSVLAS